MTIDDLRRQIDRIDGDMVRLLNERAACALTVRDLERASELMVCQPARGGRVLRHVRAPGAAQGGLPGADALGRLFERIIDKAHRIERVQVAGDGGPLGPPGP